MLSIDAAALFAFSALLLWPASTLLARAKWVSSAPRAGVALWQSIGVSALVAGIGGGLCVGVERFHSGFGGGVAKLFDSLTQGDPLRGLGLYDALGLTLATDLGVVLIFLLAYITVRTARARARHRRLVDLLSSDEPEATGALLLDHPKAVAYCLPGFRPRIVISAGTVDLLSKSELAAVLSHEQGHATERHGLVMMPMVGIGICSTGFPMPVWLPRAWPDCLKWRRTTTRCATTIRARWCRHLSRWPLLARPVMCPCHRLGRRHRAGQPAAQRLEKVPWGCRCCCVRLHRAAPRPGDRPHRLLRGFLSMWRGPRAQPPETILPSGTTGTSMVREPARRNRSVTVTLRPNFSGPRGCSSMR